MGLYDTVIIDKNYKEIIHGVEEDFVLGVQIKSTDCEMKDYEMGDEINLPDGVHVGYEGWFVVDNRRIIFVGQMIYDKYGCELIKEELMNARNPIARVVDGMAREEDNGMITGLLDSLKNSSDSIVETVNKIKVLISRR